MTFVRGIDSWLQCIAHVLVSSASKYLDAEDEGQNVRPAEDGDDADAAEDSDGAVLVGVFLSPPSGAPPRRTR